MLEIAQSNAIPTPQSQTSDSNTFAKKTFESVIDTVNPLHHIPIIGQLYRTISGDEISPQSSFAGGFLFGGPLGALGATASLIIGGVIGDMSGNNDTVQTAFNAHSAKNLGGDAPRHPRIDISDPWRFNS